MQQLILMGTFFVLPVYLQVVLGFDAFETGKRLFPLSIALLLAALAGPKLAVRLAPKRGLPGRARRAGDRRVLPRRHDRRRAERPALRDRAGVFGVGRGPAAVAARQRDHVVGRPARTTNEAGGLQGTAQNLGASLGTALIGSVLLPTLTSGFIDRIEKSPEISKATQEQFAEVATKGIPIVTVAEVEKVALDAGLSEKEAAAISSDYASAELDGLKLALLAVAFFAVLALWFTRRLPSRRTPREHELEGGENQ